MTRVRDERTRRSSALIARDLESIISSRRKRERRRNNRTRRYLSSLSTVPSIVRTSCLEAVQARMY